MFDGLNGFGCLRTREDNKSLGGIAIELEGFDLDSMLLDLVS